MERRSFLKTTGLAAAAFGLNTEAFAGLNMPPKNKLPKWKGFNLLDFFSPNPSSSRRGTTEEHLKWMRDWGFDFIRIPIAYPWYLDIDRTRNITPEETPMLSLKPASIAIKPRAANVRCNVLLGTQP